MKKAFFLATVIFLAGAYASSAQFRSIPSEVTTAFKEKFPDAEKVSWHDKITAFAADFTMNDETMEARFNSKGEWQSTEKEINQDDVPAEVMEGFHKSKYADWSVDKVTYIEMPGSTIQYRLLTEKNDLQKKNLLFNADGRLLKDSITL